MDKPEYIPLPRTGTKCPYCGLSRSGIYNLIGSNKANKHRAVVDSITVCLPGKKRGRTLVHYASLMNHLNGQMVPVEQLNLRKAWRAFRSQPRQKWQEASGDIPSLEFLSEEEAEKAGLEPSDDIAPAAPPALFPLRYKASARSRDSAPRLALAASRKRF